MTAPTSFLSNCWTAKWRGKGHQQTNSSSSCFKIKCVLVLKEKRLLASSINLTCQIIFGFLTLLHNHLQELSTNNTWQLLINYLSLSVMDKTQQATVKLTREGLRIRTHKNPAFQVSFSLNVVYLVLLLPLARFIFPYCLLLVCLC